jgi:Concanavalin A-like lectin/glucanases superfamily
VRHPFLRTLAGATTDPNFENVTLLLHGDGTNGGQNNTFVDGSTNNFTITRNGNTTQGTFSPYGDNWSNHFDGTGDYLLTPTNAALSVGTGSFTCEMFVYFNALDASNCGIVSQLTATDGSLHSIVFLTVGSTVYLRVQNLIAVAFEGTATVQVGQWYHFALVRSGTNIAAFVNGSRINSGTNSTDIVKQVFTIGRLYSGTDSAYSKAYISNVRLVKGSAVYDPTQTTLTVPTAPLIAITNTSLLTCQSNRFLDTSTNNFTITRNGDVSVQRFSPFSPSSAYSSSTIGGSGYLDGSGDYLGIPSGACSYTSGTAYTLDCWIYPTSYPTQYPQIMAPSAFTGVNAASLYLENNGTIAFGQSGVGNVLVSASGSIRLNCWNHIAIGKSSANSARMWVNGVSVATTTDTKNYAAGSMIVGQNGNASERFAGYISDFRSVTGSDVYGTGNTTITVPTAPVSAVTNTKLLLSFQNAGIIDNAMMAVPETVGNAQIDTTTKKYGTGSLEFDGNGDYLHCKYPSADISAFGTGDFTVEFWLYTAVANTSYNVIDWRPTSTQGAYLSFYLQTGTPKVYFNSADQITGGSTIPATTWTHIAICRSGSSMRLFVGGTQSGSTLTNTTNFIGSTNRPAIGGFGGFTNDPLNGYIDDLRITKGVARYTANFTAPTAAFPDL